MIFAYKSPKLFFLAGAMISVSSMATIFGTAGAGLAGYKMMKRTRGLQEFKFEFCPDGVLASESNASHEKKSNDSNEADSKVNPFQPLLYSQFNFSRSRWLW